MKKLAPAMLALVFLPVICPAQDLTTVATPTPVRYRSLAEANRKIRELQAENEALQIRDENAQLHRMSRDYDEAHPQPYFYPCPVPAYPVWGGWGDYHYHHYPGDIHHHYHHHHHHHHH